MSGKHLATLLAIATSFAAGALPADVDTSSTADVPVRKRGGGERPMPEPIPGLYPIVRPATVTERELQVVPPDLSRIKGPLRSHPPEPKRLSPEPLHVDPLQQLTQCSAVPNPSLITTFDSTDYDTNFTITGDHFIPPDPHAASGPEHVVDVTNVILTCYLKDGTLPLQGSLKDFFDPLMPLTETFDPKVIYDQHAGRFLIVTLEKTLTAEGDADDTSRIFLAVSDDSNPEGFWFLTEFPSLVPIQKGGMSVPHWADYPGFAVDEGEVYISLNMFDITPNAQGDFEFGGVRLWYVNKGLGTGGFYDGGSVTVNLIDPYQQAGNVLLTQPAHVFGRVNPDFIDRGTFLVGYEGLTDAGTGEQLVQVTFFQPVGPAAQVHLVPVGMIETDPFLATNPLPDAPQSGSLTDIETNDRRTLNAVWRDDRLWVTTTIDPLVGDPEHGQATAHWFEVNTENLSSLILEDQGSISGEDIATGTHTFFPSVAVNAVGEAAIGFSASSGGICPGAYYALREPSDPAGTFGSSQILRTGIDVYVRTFGGNSNRWGDYSGISVDPVDQCFWAFNEYALEKSSTDPAPDNGRWGTAYGKLCIAECVSQLTVDNQVFSSAETFRAESLTVGSTVTVTGTGNLNLYGGTVAIESDFSVEIGGLLTIRTDVCPSPPPPP